MSHPTTVSDRCADCQRVAPSWVRVFLENASADQTLEPADNVPAGNRWIAGTWRTYRLAWCPDCVARYTKGIES